MLCTDTSSLYLQCDKTKGWMQENKICFAVSDTFTARSKPVDRMKYAPVIRKTAQYSVDLDFGFRVASTNRTGYYLCHRTDTGKTPSNQGVLTLYDSFDETANFDLPILSSRYFHAIKLTTFSFPEKC